MQFDINIAKINFTMTNLTGFTKNWFEIGLNQKN